MKAAEKKRTISNVKWQLFVIPLCFLLMTAFAAGCAGGRTVIEGPGQLASKPPAALADWGLPGKLILQGDGNSCRVVTGKALGADAALELAAGSGGQAEYYQECPAAEGMTAFLRLQFLSTQGTGRIKLSALDAAGRELAAAGWIITGPPASGQPRERWEQRPFYGNYGGDWLSEQHNVMEALKDLLPPAAAKQVKTYRASVIAGQGQHALITQLYLAPDRSRALKVTTARKEYAVNMGEPFTVEADVENVSPNPLNELAMELTEPPGYGLEVKGGGKKMVSLPPGGKQRLSWEVNPRRPHAVNLGRPWTLSLTVDGTALPATPDIKVAVNDPRPGKIFYVMTEDLEAIDGAGYAVPWGNGDGWLDPQELKVQMIDKPNKLNSIAEKYGAKWTHYTAWPLIKAAEWAAARSTSGQWSSTAEAIRRSVTVGAARGHEYGIHLHIDYDPRLPDNVLSYNPATDGFWANHLRHGWAHSTLQEGGPEDAASRTGSLFYYQRQMDELSAGSPLGQLLTARAGSFDFGNGAASEAMSTRAFRKTGLWGSSDADGNAGGITSADYGQEIYLAKADDINTAATEMSNVGVVEFRPTPRNSIAYDHDSAAVMNAKADQGVQAFSANGAVKPGIHAITGFTHAMFMMGAGDWRTTEGGQFQALDEHLGYLKSRYGDKGLLQFASATRLVREYLDYYALQPVAVYDQQTGDRFGVAEYPITILGRDIPIDPARPQRISVKYPLYFRDSAFRIAIYKDGKPIYATWGLPTPYNDIVFFADDKAAQYTMKVYHNRYVYGIIEFVKKICK